MDKKWAIVFALIATPALTELLTSNTPLPAFFLPINLLWLILGYGLPLLVIRELAIRWKLGLWGVVILGVAYGILNEGIIAQTLLHPTNLPIGNFDGYLRAGGINIGWALYIVFWHVLHSVLYPLLLVGFLRNDWNSWLGDRAFKWSAGFLLAGSLIVVLIFKNPSLIFLEAVMIALVFLAKRFKKKVFRASQLGTWKLSLLGFCSIFYAILLFIGAGRKWPGLIFVLIALLIPWCVYRYLSKKDFISHRGILLFGLGSYIAYAAFAMLLGIGVIIITNIILIGLLIWAIVEVSKNLTASALEL